MYITSRDNPSAHDLFMIVYLVLTLPWMIICTLSARTPSTRRYRQLALAGFVATLPPLIYQYYRHSTLRIAGA
ncbi:UNVERIFIED_CONTAM: Frag1/DRAM/Sfk1 family protein, partial [Bacteroidetes bacterium 56_B9]